MRAGVGSCLGERAELLLRARNGRSPGAGCPAPSHQAVLSEMMHELAQVSAAIARGILDLLASGFVPHEGARYRFRRCRDA